MPKPKNPGNTWSIQSGANAVALLFLVFCCLALVGCSTTKSRAEADAQMLQMVECWQPYQMYLLSSPHPRLYVEVDAVEGCSPSDDALNRLRAFLATYCDKPGGIEIVRSDVIPLKKALGVLPSALARKYLNGPPQNASGPPPAFLYVLFFKDVQSDRPVVVETGHPGAKSAPRSRLRTRNPHVDTLPYPAMIYMNVNWSPKSLHDKALLHEAGHVLGLAFRPANASGGHCLSRRCLMTASVHLLRLLLGMEQPMQDRLCEHCVAQLAQNRAKPPPSNLRFVGPVLVRSEEGYQVLNLPGRVKLIAGELSEQDCLDFAAAVHSEAPSPLESEGGWQAQALAKPEILRDPAKMREVITRAIADPHWYVRRVAPRLWLALAGQCNASGDYTNAVTACHEAIKADPEDHQSFNLLAWIKATCADPSVRDGKEAVSAATRACELTQWQYWSWIDTLAAAYAEAGDFKRAIKFQQQALRMSGSSESEQKDMRQRLSLYQQSQPFRDKH